MSREPEPVTEVLYRRFIGSPGEWDADPIALFPRVQAGGANQCMSYMRVGQHSSATYDIALDNTRTVAASIEEPDVLELHRKLERIGYRLRILPQPKPVNWRAQVKAAYPHVRVTVKTVHFEDLARKSAQFGKVSGYHSPEEYQAVAAILKREGIIAQ